ncbi:MAG: diguanylate cyclase, partial [Acidobacteriota bacterium]
FCDGELDEAESARVAAALEADGVLRARMSNILSDAALLAEASEPERDDPATEALAAKLGAALDRKQRRPDFQFAVLAVDVADFYSIRQRHGRHSSEQLLVTLARRLMASARPLDAVGRLPDAEFVLVMPNLDDKGDAWAVAWRLETRLTEPIRIDDEPLQVSPRWGITLSADTFDGPHDMLGAAVLESKTF